MIMIIVFLIIVYFIGFLISIFLWSKFGKTWGIDYEHNPEDDDWDSNELLRH